MTATELLETLHVQAERMSRLVEQLLDMSRLDAASIQIRPELLTLLPELEEIVRTNAPGREQDVVIDTPGTEKILAARDVLERVVGNLVTNALRYGAPPVRVVARRLGLAIARAYARAHSGDLLFHTGEGGGALFELVLPRTTPPPA